MFYLMNVKTMRKKRLKNIFKIWEKPFLWQIYSKKYKYKQVKSEKRYHMVDCKNHKQLF